MKKFVVLFFIIVVSGCTALAVNNWHNKYGKPEVKQRIVAHHSSDGQFYQSAVKPVLESRCVVCHGCYDAPCQLKLTSAAGIDRGISKELVYDGTRLVAAKPHRLFIDADSTSEWRELGFSPVLNEYPESPANNLAASLLYNTLLVKKSNPLPQVAQLGDEYDFSLDRTATCASIESYQQVAEHQPSLGMPYGFPAVDDSEFNVLQHWLMQGAKMTNLAPVDQFTAQQVEKWEAFLNQAPAKHQLMARYIYEHWFLTNIYFSNAKEQYFYKLVRSTTPPGEPIDVIATRRPFDEPNVARVYYRLQRNQASILAKNHIPLALNNKELARLHQLFIATDYTVSELPSYAVDVASNPFKSFAQIPTEVKYQFLLDHSQTIIMGFIKGPVCRGQVALNVINDHFWVAFVEPKRVANANMDEFFHQVDDLLAMPAEEQSNALPISSWVKYARLQAKFLARKTAKMNESFAGGKGLDMSLLWQGEGHNDNAALTIFRHFDSATVVKGLVGQAPKTMWVLDYSLFERIHYLLVAGFDVYGNVGHQLVTRLYMDFLRMEGEQNFLAFLPLEERRKVRNHWYRKAPKNLVEHLESNAQFNQETGIKYQTNAPKAELYSNIKQHLSAVLNTRHKLANDEISQALGELNSLPNAAVQQLAQISFILVKQQGQHKAFSLLHHNAHFNISSLLNEGAQRAPREDTASLVNGFIGDYPAVLFYLEQHQVNEFVTQFSKVKTEKDYIQLKTQFAIRRTDPEFWRYSDILHKTAKQNLQIEYGIFDYNRFENK